MGKTDCINNYSDFEDRQVQHFIDGISSLSCGEESLLTKNQVLSELDQNNLLTLHNQFFYITDCAEVINIYVHPHIKNVLGYEPEFFHDYHNVYSCLHPEEKEFIINFSLESILYPRTMPPEMQKLLFINPFLMVFSLGFRMKRSDGEYIWVHRLTSCYRADMEGHMVYTLSFYTDISDIKKTSDLTFGWKGDPYEKFHVDELCRKYLPHCFSNREVEIVNLFSKGFPGP